MKGSERRRQLLEWLEQAGHLTLPQISERFDVSKMTIHRDLVMLEDNPRDQEYLRGQQGRTRRHPPEFEHQNGGSEQRHGDDAVAQRAFHPAGCAGQRRGVVARRG